tara:strand:- start:2383 stop:3198 length:816 start_codon:yes stop_codon:yes gene_type:complete
MTGVFTPRDYDTPEEWVGEIRNLDNVVELAVWCAHRGVTPNLHTGRMFKPHGDGMFMCAPSHWGDLFEDIDFVSQDDEDTIPTAVWERMLIMDDVMCEAIEKCRDHGSLFVEIMTKVRSLLYVIVRVDTDTLPDEPPEFFSDVRKWTPYPDAETIHDFVQNWLIPATVSETVRLLAHCGVDGVEITDGFVSINSLKLSQAGFDDFCYMLRDSGVTEQMGGSCVELSTSMSEEERAAAIQEVMDSYTDFDFDPDSDDNDDETFNAGMRSVGP